MRSQFDKFLEEIIFHNKPEYPYSVPMHPLKQTDTLIASVLENKKCRLKACIFCMLFVCGYYGTNSSAFLAVSAWATQCEGVYWPSGVPYSIRRPMT